MPKSRKKCYGREAAKLKGKLLSLEFNNHSGKLYSFTL